jgi:hypothetical protein
MDLLAIYNDITRHCYRPAFLDSTAQIFEDFLSQLPKSLVSTMELYLEGIALITGAGKSQYSMHNVQHWR